MKHGGTQLVKYLAELSGSVTVLQTQNVCVGECGWREEAGGVDKDTAQGNFN